MKGGFFCVPKTKRSVSKSKKRKTSGGKTKKATITKSKKSKSAPKLVKGASKRRRVSRRSKSQKGGATIGIKPCDPLGRGTYPVVYNSMTDCSGVHHK